MPQLIPFKLKVLFYKANLFFSAKGHQWQLNATMLRPCFHSGLSESASFFLFWKLQTPLFKMKCPGATFKKPRKAEMATGLLPPCLLWVNAKILWETVSFPIDERGGLTFHGLNLFWLNSACFYFTLYSVPSESEYLWVDT